MESKIIDRYQCFESAKTSYRKMRVSRKAFFRHLQAPISLHQSASSSQYQAIIRNSPVNYYQKNFQNLTRW